MKKLLGIVVLGLLFTLNMQIAKSETYTGQHGTYDRGTDKRSFCKSELKNKVWTRSQFCVSPSPYFKRSIEVMDGWDSLRLDNKELHSFPRYAIFTDVTKARTKWCGFIPYSCLKKSGNGKLYALVWSWSEAEDILDEIDPVRAEKKAKEAEKQKTVAEKPKGEKIYEWGTPICVKLNVPTFISDIKNCSGGSAYVVNKYHSNYDYYFSLLSKTHKVTGKPKKRKESSDDKLLAASMGSGFFVTKAGHLVTNYHVIEECNAVKTNILGKEIRTNIIAIDKTNDLAIIKAEMNPSKVFPVSNEDVSLMQDVIVAGFPLGKKVSSAIKIHKGSVTALAGFGDNYSNFQTDATINQGNSGGPIMNQKGNVVGVAVQLIAAEHAQNVFFGVKSSTLKTFANAHNVKFLSPNYREMSNEDLGKLITEATVFLECWMTVAKIKQMIAQEENRKAFYSEHK